MNRIAKFDNPGGLKFYQDVLAFMQAAQVDESLYISKAIGNNVIIDGCVVAGGNISAGIVIIDNKMVAFSGGSNLGRIKLTETITTEEFSDNVARNFYYAYTAVPHASEGVLVSDFIRLKTLRDLAAITGNSLPTQTSDSYQNNSSNHLATSKAVYALWKVLPTVKSYEFPLYSPSVPLYTEGEGLIYASGAGNSYGNESVIAHSIFGTGYKYRKPSEPEWQFYTQAHGLPAGFTPPWPIFTTEALGTGFQNGSQVDIIVRSSWLCYTPFIKIVTLKNN